jgi:uncharacterized protein YdeI (YjbR/CyaY-like superfamily)
MKPKYFATPSEFRAWLEAHHETEQELLVGFYRKSSGKPSLTWPESVDAALCFGWIDGIRRGVDAIRYTIRFTPRKPSSTWSAINIRRVAELAKLGHMRPAGLRAFAKRRDEKSSIYSYEQRKSATLGAAYEKRFRARKNAWKFFQAQPPSYRKMIAWWIASAKKEETKSKRLAKVIEASANSRRLF